MKQRRWKSNVALMAAEFFYCGRCPYAPGTVGSLASLVIWVPAIYCAWPLWVKIALIIVLFFIGVWASGYGIAHYKKNDPKQVVIDEVVGQGLPLLIVAPNPWEIAVAFLCFRFFDIVKPWPIKAVERAFPDRLGIMLDDVVAGILAMMVLFIGKIIFVS